MKKIRNNLSSIIIVIVFLFGLGLLLYPSLANWWNNNLASHAVADYTSAVSQMKKEDHQEFFDAAVNYNADLLNRSQSFTLSDEEMKEYQQLLTVNESGMMGSIEIPSIRVSLPIYHGTSQEVLAVGTGHLEGSSLPVGGSNTHTVITGHRGLPSAKLFTDLDQVVEGDYVILNILDRILTYQVDQIRIVEPEEISELQIQPEQDLLTLVTCTPYGINSHRLLVTGHRVENMVEWEGVAEGRLIDSKLVALFVAIPILVGLFIYLLIHYRKPKE